MISDNVMHEQTEEEIEYISETSLLSTESEFDENKQGKKGGFFKKFVNEKK